MEEIRTLEWIQDSIVDQKLLHQYYREFYSYEKIHLPKPSGINPPNWSTERDYLTSYTGIIENGGICRKQCFVITPDNKLLIDMVHPRDCKHFNPEQLPPVTHQEETVAVLAYGGYQKNYYHWLMDIIPRIHLIQMSGITVDKYVFQKLGYPFQFETLNKLGISREKIIEIDNDMFHLKAKKLVVTSVTRRRGKCAKWACEFLRQTFLKEDHLTKSNHFERIYISRGDAGSRRVVNEQEVMDVLSKKGFKRIVLSSLSQQEQIDIFSSAKFIVSPHGAGLANLVFCNPGTKIIELYNVSSDCYLRISHHMKLLHYFLRCDIGSEPKIRKVANDLFVDVSQLRELLDRLDS